MSNENNNSNKPRTSRVIGVVLWADNDIHIDEVQQLLNDNRAVGIYHDRDINDNGKVKKAHWHFLYKFDNPATFGSMLKILPNHEENNLYFVKSFKGQARYLLHLDNPEKTQYNDYDLLGNVQMIKKFIVSDEKFGQDMIKISDFIDTYDGYISFNVLFHFLYDNDCYGSYRAFQNTFLKQIDLHNKRC